MLNIMFLGTVILLGILYMKSKGKYNEFFQPLNKKEYPLKESFMPMAFSLLKSVKYQYKTCYDNNLRTKIADLYGYKNALYYLQVYWTDKIGYLLVGFLVVSFLLAAIGEVDVTIVVFFLLVLIIIFFAPDYDLKNKLEKRNLQIRLDFPDFLNKLILLINAGMTVSKAWEKVAVSNKKSTPLYEEIEKVRHDIVSGKSEYQAYEDFARRCRVPEVTRFTAVVLQNLKKGSSELVSVLRLQSGECWEMRKNAAKKIGEEASTKLLLPMMMMFIAILLIVAMPAVLAMKSL